MRYFTLFLIVVLGFSEAVAQTASTTSGNWNDATIWSNGVPGGATTTTVTHPVTINQDIAITSGDYTLNSNVTDLPGGTAYTLSVGGGGILDVGGYVVFEGAGSTLGSGPNFAEITVRSGATLVLGGSTTIGNKSTIVVEAGGTLIINGNLTIDDNQGTFTISGTLEVNGNLSIPQGNIQIDGTGDVFTTGTIFSTGSSTIFGSTGDCDTGPCSGRNLCDTFDNAIQAAETLCSGSTPAQLTNLDNTGVSGGAVYAWEQSTTSSSSGFTTISGATSSTYQPPSLTQTTWYRRLITDAGCTGTSAPVKITVVPSDGWNGTTSDWHTGSNWCGGSVPLSTTDVVINPGVPFQPVISAAAVCRSLTINASASVTITGSNTLAISGNLTNNGTLTVNSSTVTFNGTTTQTIGGTSINIFNNLVINNTSGLTPAISMSGINNVGVNNTLTMTAGLIDLNGYNFTIGQSTASPGTLSYTAGRFYDGNLMRWFNTTAKTIPAATTLFPVGTVTDYRPMYAGHSALTTGGTIRVSHTGITGSTDVAFSDDVPVQKISNSFWSVATANGLNVGSNAFSLRVEGTGFGTIQEVTDLRLTQASSAPGSPDTNGGTITNPQVNRTALPLTAINNDVFYLASVDGTNSPLPVVLTYFNAVLEDNAAVLTWATEKEENFSHFEVERGSGNFDFEHLATVNGSGHNTQSLRNYSFVDPNVAVGTTYYRLKSVDVDGSYRYSKVVYVALESELNIEIYPNPVSQQELRVKIHFNPQQSDRFTLTDMQGRDILHFTELISGENSIKLGNRVKPGMYLLRYQNSSFSKSIKVMVKP